MKGGAHQSQSAYCVVSLFRELKLGQSLHRLHTPKAERNTYGLKLWHQNTSREEVLRKRRAGLTWKRFLDQIFFMVWRNPVLLLRLGEPRHSETWGFTVRPGADPIASVKAWPGSSVDLRRSVTWQEKTSCSQLAGANVIWFWAENISLPKKSGAALFSELL